MVDADLSVREIIGSMFDVSPDSITRETVAADVDGWDSLGHVTLMMMIERRLKVVLGEDDAGDLSDVGALIDKVAGQLNGA